MLGKTLRILTIAGPTAFAGVGMPAHEADAEPQISQVQAGDFDIARTLRRRMLPLICNNPVEIAKYTLTCNLLRNRAQQQACFKDKMDICGSGDSPVSTTVADADGISVVGAVNPAFTKSVRDTMRVLPSYAARIAQQSNLKIIIGPTIVDAAKSLGLDFTGASAEQIAQLNSTTGLHVAATGNIQYPAIYLPEKYATAIDTKGKITYAPNEAPVTSTNHEVSHNTLNYLGNLLNSPVDEHGRKDFAYSKPIIDTYKKDVMGLFTIFRGVAQQKGIDSTEFKTMLREAQELSRVIPVDAWEHIKTGALDADKKIQIKKGEIPLGAKETLAQAMSNAHGTDTSVLGAELKAVYEKYLPNISEAGKKIHAVLTDYDSRHTNKADFENVIRKDFSSDFEKPLAPKMRPVAPGARPGAAPT